MSGDVIAYEQHALSAADIRAQVNRIQEVMKAVMKDGQHFGKIPGAGDKPTLLKPGAEKIMATFRLAADPEVEDISGPDAIRYRVRCRLSTHGGLFVGCGVGECSTDEEKYKWRAVNSQAEWDATPEDRRRIKYGKSYQGREGKQIQQIRTNPADLANTVLKMAKKRALVDAVLTATAASDIFTQDIEDLPEDLAGQIAEEEKPAMKPPQEKKLDEKASSELKVTLLQAASETTAFKHLENWYKKHRDEIMSLQDEDKDEVLMAVEAKKNEFKLAEEE